MLRIEHHLQNLPEAGATELVLSEGHPPYARSARGLTPLAGEAELDLTGLRRLIAELVSAEQWQQFVEQRSMSFAKTIDAQTRVRGLCTETEQGITCTLRVLPKQAASCSALGLPASVAALTTQSSGLVLVAGAANSGKSSTLSALVTTLAEQRSAHVVMLSEVSGLTHENHKAIVSQRRAGEHFASLAAGVELALMADPDVLVIDGLDAAETARAALCASGVGVLVIGSLRLRGAARALDRMIAAFPADQRAYACSELADNLLAVISQELAPKAGGGRVAALEILLRSPNLSAVLSEGKTGMIGSIIEAGRSAGMQSMDAALLELTKQGIVDGHDAFARANDKKTFVQWGS